MGFKDLAVNNLVDSRLLRFTLKIDPHAGGGCVMWAECKVSVPGASPGGIPSGILDWSSLNFLGWQRPKSRSCSKPSNLEGVGPHFGQRNGQKAPPSGQFRWTGKIRAKKVYSNGCGKSKKKPPTSGSRLLPTEHK